MLLTCFNKKEVQEDKHCISALFLTYFCTVFRLVLAFCFVSEPSDFVCILSSLQTVLFNVNIPEQYFTN